MIHLVHLPEMFVWLGVLGILVKHVIGLGSFTFRGSKEIQFPMLLLGVIVLHDPLREMMLHDPLRERMYLMCILIEICSVK